MPSNSHWDDERFDVYDGKGPEGEPRPRAAKSGSGMSAMKIFVVLLIVGAVVMLLLCGGIVWFARNAATTTTVPAEVEARTGEFVELDVPENLKPKMAVRVEFIDFDMAVYQSDDEQGLLMLMNLPVGFDEARGEFEKEVQKHQQNEDVKIEETDVREFEIRGDKVPFTFAKGTVQSGARKIRQVSGAFRGRRGTTFLFLQVPEEDYDEEAVVRMIESIQ